LKPENINYLTELDTAFTKDLMAIQGTELFEKFIKKWKYWLDEETKKLSGKDWKWVNPLIKECRNEKITPEKRHDPASALLMPERIFKISLVAWHFKVPWGCAYIRMKEMGQINY